jgi:SAM-dependent methyltransferase
MMNARADDWDQHWRDFASAAEKGPAHEFRRQTILRLLDIPAIGQPISLLEIGSGTGEFAETFLSRYPKAEFVGLELSEVGVGIASRRVPSARFIQRNLLLSPCPEEPPSPRANVAVCSEVLEHLDDPALLLRNSTAYMAPNCRLVVTVPGGPQSAFDRHIGHRKHYSPKELKALLGAAGFEVEAVYGAGFPFFNLYRATIILRGNKLREDVSGPPSFLIRAGAALFGVLLRWHLMRWGWQTIAVARYQGRWVSAAHQQDDHEGGKGRSELAPRYGMQFARLNQCKVSEVRV